MFDLTGTQMERPNKLMPYAFFKEIDYTVAIFRIGDLIKVSLGTNPWSDKDSSTNLATLAERYGGRWILGSRLGHTRHQITHRSLRIELHSAELGDEGEIGEGIEGRWVEPSQVATLARSSLVDKL